MQNYKEENRRPLVALSIRQTLKKITKSQQLRGQVTQAEDVLIDPLEPGRSVLPAGYDEVFTARRCWFL